MALRRAHNVIRGRDDRQSRRVRAYDLIKVRRFDENSTHLISNIKDLSTGGLKFFCREKLPSGEDVVLTVNFADHNDQISARGRVMWTKRFKAKNGYYTGVSFLDLNDRDYQLVQRLTAG